MNRKNAINHALSKLKKFKLNPIKNGKKYIEIAENFHSIPSDNEIYYCGECSSEDFGYCGLRNSKLSNEYIFIELCCDAMIKVLKKEIAKKRKNRRR